MIDYHRNFLQQGAQNCGRFSFIHILSCRFNPIRSQLETILDFWLLNVCMKECELINPFTARVLACTFTWCYLFFKISRNKIWKFGQKLLLAKLGSERVKGGHTFGLLAVNKYTLIYFPLLYFHWKIKGKAEKQVLRKPWVTKGLSKSVR